jgi:hypothetical protein
MHRLTGQEYLLLEKLSFGGGKSQFGTFTMQNCGSQEPARNWLQICLSNAMYLRNIMAVSLPWMSDVIENLLERSLVSGDMIGSQLSPKIKA